ncbi:hypothetical protein V1281_001475 [Nitrobacteraceae bacterium AZCC 2161]
MARLHGLVFARSQCASELLAPLLPAFVLRFGAVLDPVPLGRYRGIPRAVLLPGGVEGFLCLGDLGVPAVVLLGPGELFPMLCGFPFLLLLLEGDGCSLTGFFAGGRCGGWMGLFCPLGRRGRAFSGPKTGRKIGGLLEGALCAADGSPEDDARMSDRGRDDGQVVGLLREALVEQIAVGAPDFERGLHGGRGDGQVEEADRRLIGLELPRHR